MYLFQKDHESENQCFIKTSKVNKISKGYLQL